MNKDEFKIIMATLITAYPAMGPTKEMMSLWYENLKDLDYKTAHNAVKKIIQENEFAPSIATIRKQSLSILGHGKKSKADCIALINKAISKFGRYQISEAMDWIKEQDETTYNVVKAVGLMNYCNSDPNFSNNLIIKMYSEVADNKEKQLLLSKKFSEQIAEIRLNSNRLLALEGEC